ncbi:MAG: glycosyltransferase family 2 protein, partial [Candidatus Binatia bacterium]
MKISAVIIAFNEEGKIADAIRSVSWADEILVVDSESTDATRQIASDLGARVVIRSWLGFSKQKQFAVDAAKNDWIFSLDADERVSDVLKTEILSLLEGDKTDADGYRMPRLSFYMDRPIRHSGWYPDRQLRLFDRRRAGWNERLVHESVRFR